MRRSRYGCARIGFLVLFVLAGCAVDLGKLRAPHGKDAASFEAAVDRGAEVAASDRDSKNLDVSAPDGPHTLADVGADLVVFAAESGKDFPDVGPEPEPDGSPPVFDSSVPDQPLDTFVEDEGDVPSENPGLLDASTDGGIAIDAGDDSTTSAREDAVIADAGDRTPDSATAIEADAGVQGPTWIQIASGSPPHFRAAVGYDPNLQRAALFGGFGSCMEYFATSQTWEWDGTAWTKQTPTGSIPSARAGIGMAFDRVHGEAIIHGGWTAPNTLQTGTYAYNLGTHAWTSRGGSPQSYEWYAIDYDTDADLVRLFGGSDSTAFSRNVRTWNSTAQVWQSSTSNGPGARARHAWVFAQDHHRFVMFGGVSNWGGPHLSDTWEYDPDKTTWQQTATTGVRPQDCDVPPTMTYDPVRKLVVMYCSLNGGETWEYDPSAHAWSKAVGASPMGAIVGSSLFYDQKLRSVLLVAGCKSGTVQDGTWQYIPGP